MADWGQRAKDKDRDDAIKVIEDAAARGQIVDVDRQKRIQEVQAAGTVGEIELITRGLVAAPAAPLAPAGDVPEVSQPGAPVAPTFQTYTPPTTPPVTEPDPTPPPAIQYGEPLTPSAGTPIGTPPMIRKGGHAGKLVLIVVLIVMAGIAVPVFIGIKALVDTVNDGIDSITPGEADVFSDDGYADMVDAIKEETGSTEAFSLSLYDGYAVIYAPTEARGKRYIAYRFDGSLSEFTKGSETDERRFDLTDIDPGVLRRMKSQAAKLVEDPTSNYVLVSPPFSNDNAWISGYASNDFSESGHLTATLEGKVVATYPPS